MNTAEFQSQIIDRLDRVVAGAEALMMDERARTVADFERLKSEIQGLLDVVTAFERMCHGESSLQSVKQTIAALKRTVETERVSAEAQAPVMETHEVAVEEEDGFSFGFEPLPAVDEKADLAEADGMGAETGKPAEGDAIENVTDKPKTIEPELGLRFDDEPEPTPEPEPAVVAEPAVSESVVSEPVAVAEPFVESETSADAASEAEPEATAQLERVHAPEPEPVAPESAAPEQAEPDPASSANAIFEAIKQESLAQFSVREEDQPQSYITQLTAMAQAQVKPGEQDMSGVAVSSTARPDAAPEPVSSGDSLMESLRSTRANLHGGQLRTMVDKFKAPQTIYDLQHTRTVDLKMTIGVNEKYLLTQELFNGNVKEYGEAVGRLNDAKDAAAAMAIWQALSAQRGWDENSLAYATFYDLLRRRFPDLA